ncbi:hypothetical protein ACXN5S_11370 [Pseudoroseicyclus sp. H15]
MMRLATPLCALLFATPALGQGLEMESMGTIEVEFIGESLTFWVPYLTDHEEPYAQLVGPMGASVLSINAHTGEPGVKLGDPRMALSFVRPGPNIAATNMQYFPGGPAPMYVSDMEMGSFTLESAEVDGDHYIIDFTATVVPVDEMTYEPMPDESPIEMSGHIDVTLRGE